MKTWYHRNIANHVLCPFIQRLNHARLQHIEAKSDSQAAKSAETKPITFKEMKVTNRSAWNSQTKSIICNCFYIFMTININTFVCKIIYFFSLCTR